MTRVGRRDLERGSRIPKEERAAGARMPQAEHTPPTKPPDEGSVASCLAWLASDVCRLKSTLRVRAPRWRRSPAGCRRRRAPGRAHDREGCDNHGALLNLLPKLGFLHPFRLPKKLCEDVAGRRVGGRHPGKRQGRDCGVLLPPRPAPSPVLEGPNSTLSPATPLTFTGNWKCMYKAIDWGC